MKIPLNLFDLIFIFVSAYVYFFNKKYFINFILKVLANDIKRKLLISFLLLFTYLFTVLIFKQSNFTNSQLIIQFLHLLKLFQCFIYSIIIFFLIQRVNFENIIKYLMVISFLFSILGCLHFLSIINIVDVIDNRMVFGGLIILNLFGNTSIISINK